MVVPKTSRCYTFQVNSKALSLFAAIGLCCCLCGSPLTRGSTAAAQSAASAKSLTRLLEEHYRLPRTLQAVFLERFSEGPKQARIESGTVYFRRPGQMRWEYESPEKKLFLVDGRNAWFYVPFDHTVTKTPVKESSDWRTPLSLLTKKTDLSHLCSQIDVVSQAGIPDGHSVLRCLPKGANEAGEQAQSHTMPAEQGLSESENYLEVLLEVDSSTGELARIEIHQAGGIELEYRFGNWQTDVPLSADLFHFQVPAGVAIVDGTSPSRDSN
jgi:outer membrane lipoprotein carrier protein